MVKLHRPVIRCSPSNRPVPSCQLECWQGPVSLPTNFLCLDIEVRLSNDSEPLSPLSVFICPHKSNPWWPHSHLSRWGFYENWPHSLNTPHSTEEYWYNRRLTIWQFQQRNTDVILVPGQTEFRDVMSRWHVIMSDFQVTPYLVVVFYKIESAGTKWGSRQGGRRLQHSEWDWSTVRTQVRLLVTLECSCLSWDEVEYEYHFLSSPSTPGLSPSTTHLWLLSWISFENPIFSSLLTQTVYIYTLYTLYCSTIGTRG